MSRRRLARLAEAWAVTLAEMEIPRAERSWQSRHAPTPSSHDSTVEKSLSDLRFRVLLADSDWHALPLAVRRCRAFSATLVATFFRRAKGPLVFRAR
jgi:hypothetical protein